MARKLRRAKTVGPPKETKPLSEHSDPRPTRGPIRDKKMAKVEEIMTRYRNTLRDLVRQ